MEVSSSNNRKKKYKMCDATSLTDLDKLDSSQSHKHRNSAHEPIPPPKQNQVGTVMLFGVPIVSLVMDGKERLCLAQISSTLLKEFSYNEIHNRRVALGITCIQCTPVQLEILRRAGAMPVTSRRCGMITRREAERLCQSFLGDHAPPQLPENFAFDVYHECAWGCRGAFVPSRYNSSRAKCIRCSFCQLFFSPNKFIFHSHRLPDSRYVQPDAANFNSWRRHLKLCGDPPDEVSLSSSPCPTFSPDDDDSRSKLPTTLATAQIVHAWEDVKAMFNGGTRKRLLAAHSAPSVRQQHPRPLSNNTGLKTATPSSSSSSSPGSSNNNNNTASNSSSSRAVTPQTTRHGTTFSQHGCGDLSSMAGGSPSFTNAGAPLLSSASRLDIWNPGISSAAAAAAAAAAVAARQCQLNPSAAANANPGLPPLPFHPLSIPWLRRPLFPFSHPFGPTCKLFGENGNGMTPADGLLASSLAGRQGQVQGQGISSAFKPVGSRGSEQLLSWFNNNALHNGGIHPALPEDLSIGSHHAHPCPELHPQASPLHQLHSKANSLAYTHLNPLNAQDSMKEMLLGPLQGDISAATIQESKKMQILDECSKIVNNNGKNAGRNDDESDDEENVDIESTELDREESFNATNNNGSYPTLWINNLNSHTINSNIRKLKRSIMQSDEVNTLTEGCHNNNNNKEMDTTIPRSNKINSSSGGGGVNKKKRLWDCDKRMINSASNNFCKDNGKQEIVSSSGSSSTSRSNSATPELLSLSSGSKEGQGIVAK